MMKYKVLPVKPDESVEEKKPLIIKSIEDSYVIDGDDVSGTNSLKNVNFGDSEFLQFKGDAKLGKLHRRVYLKFDISELKGQPIKKILLRLFGTGSQGTASTDASLYEIDANTWNQNEITFNNAPDAGAFIVTGKASKNHNFWDISEYIKDKLEKGENIVSFVLVGDENAPYYVQFASSRNGSEVGPSLVASFSEKGFLTNIATNTSVRDAWERAEKMVAEWAEDWYEILERGDATATLVREKSEEYVNQVDVASKPDKPYTSRPTRLFKNIKGYEPVKDGEIKLDEYGGHICDKKFNATGWFHIEEREGRFWAVTPLGNPFYRIAMVALASGGSDRQRKAVLDRFGSLDKWAEHETEHLRYDLGYNSLGGWCNVDLLSKVEKPLALTQIVNFISTYARVHGMNNSKTGSTTFVGGVMPVFDPTFEEYSDKRAAEIVAPYANDSHVYGWMSDNELHSEQKMLDAYLMSDTDNPWFAYSYATAWTFLRTVTGKENVDLYDITDEHRKLFRAMVYNRYFRIVSSAVKKYAPNHMFLGSRFLPGCYRDEYVQRTAGKWCDVISLNYYGAWTPESELMRDIQKWSGTPFIITEWYAKGMDVQQKDPRLTNMSGAGFIVKTQKDRGYFYNNYTLKLMECKGCAGFDWFKCWDNDPDNLNTDLSNRNSNKGIYDNDYNEYTDLTDEMKIVNANCYKLIDFFDSDKSRNE